jgi:hypothetical protein
MDTDSVAADLDMYPYYDLEYEGPHDELLPAEEEDELLFKRPRPVTRQGRLASRSASPPRDLAPPHETVPRPRPLTTVQHEQWVARLPDPPRAPLTEEEIEIQARVETRNQIFDLEYRKIFGEQQKR